MIFIGKECPRLFHLNVLKAHAFIFHLNVLREHRINTLLGVLTNSYVVKTHLDHKEKALLLVA